MSMDVRIILYFVSLNFVVVTVYGAVQQGCYPEDKRRRHYSITPGDYNPESMTPTICAAKCGAFQYNYAALTLGKFCFCGSTLPSVPAVSNTECTSTCSGDGSKTCGGPNHVDVYASSPPIIGLDLTSSTASSDGIAVVSAGSAVTFSASLTSSGPGLMFQLDYGDGSGRTGKNDTDMWTRAFYTPGTYQVTLSGNDAIDSMVEKQATTTVMVESNVKNVTLTCQEYMASYEEGTCTLKVLAGTNLQVSHSVDGVAKTPFFIADPAIYTTGADIMTTGSGTTAGHVTTDTIIMPRSEFQYSATLIGFEYYAHAVGDVKFLIFSPACNDYCFDSNTCNPTCENLHSRTCAGAIQYCSGSGNCYDTSGSTCPSLPVRYDGTQRTALTEVSSISHTISATGYGYLELDLIANDIALSPGYIIGYKRIAGTLAAVSAASADSDMSTTNLGNAGAAVSLNLRHMLRAVSSGGSTAALPYTFTTTGIKSVSVTVTNTRTSNSQSATDTVSVIEGIDKADIDVPVYAEKGSDVQFKLKPHTGTNVTFWWDFGDGNEVNTTDAVYLKQYSSTGTYNVTVIAFNPLSSKEGFITIEVQEKIQGLNLQGQYAVVGEVMQIKLDMTSGSHYSCVWTLDGVTLETTTYAQTPPNALYNHTFTLDGTYTLSTTCTNNINSMASSVQITAQRAITGVKLKKSGALLNQPYKVIFTWTDGSSPQFALEFDGVSKALTVSTFLQEVETVDSFPAESVPKTFPLNITVYNLVSNIQIVTTFGVESEITNPVPTPSNNAPLGYTPVAKGDSVTFSIDATSGTNVYVKWEHENPSNVLSIVRDLTVSTWTGTESQSITFPDLGYQNVTMTVQNAYSQHVYSYRILVIARVENLDMQLSNSVLLFAPPADVTISFIQSPPSIPPNEATIYIDYGDGTERATMDFDLATPIQYQYRKDGTFTIIANVTNVVSWQEINETVDIVEAIDKLEIVPEPVHAPKGDPVDVRVKMYRGGTGSKVRLKWDMGTGSYGAYQDRTGISPDGYDSKFHTFTTLGDHVLRVEAKSLLETKTATYTIKCQEKVTTGFTLSSNHPRDFSSGTTITYQLTYTDTIPTDAFIKVDYGDGTTSGPTALSITNSGGSQTLTHAYAVDGHFTTTFTLYNLVSSQSVTVKSGVYKDFVGLSADVKWKPSIPLNGPEKDGFGTGKDIFPQDTPVRFHMSRTQGTFVYYDIIASGNDIIVCNKTSPDLFELDFTTAKPGTYSVVIKAINPLFSRSITKTIQIYEPVEGISIDDGNIQTPAYALKTFNMSFTYVGTDSCIVVDFGDGRGLKAYGHEPTCKASSTYASVKFISSINATSIDIDHTYISKGTFVVRAEGFNEYSSAATNFTHVISTVDCSEPRVGIKNRKPKFDEPEKHTRSKRLNIIGETDINCVHTLSNKKQWTLFKIDPNDGSETAEVDIRSETSSKNAELSLPPLFLDLGLYKAVYYLVMSQEEFTSNETFSASADHFFEIVASDLVVRIFPGGTTKLNRGYDTTITIDPEANSYDPDLEAGVTNQDFDNFTWYCREKNEVYPNSMGAPFSPYTDTQLAGSPADQGGCFMQGPGQIDTNSGQLTFTTKNMKINGTYVFKVEGKKGHRMATSSAELLILDGNPPQLEITCGPNLCMAHPDGQLIRPSARLSLSMNCPVGCSGDTTYQWSVRQENYQWPDGFRDIINLSKYVDGVNSNNIAIHTSLFDLDESVLKYQVEVKATTGNGQWGIAQMILRLNTPPSGGTCTVSPSMGEALKDNFTVSCNNWTDDNNIVEYRVYTTILGDSLKRQVVYGDLESYVVQLQVGPDYDDFNTTVYVRITDSLGASTTAKAGDVQVKPMSQAEVEAKLSSITNNLKSDLDVEIARADVTRLNEIASLYASVMNTASKQTSTDYAGVDVASTQTSTGTGMNYDDRKDAFDTSKSTYEKQKAYQEKRDVHVKIVSEITSALNSVTVETMSACALTGSTLAQLSQYPENCGRNCQENIGNVVANMSSTISKLADEGSTLEEVTTAATGMISALSNILEAANVNTEYPSETDKKDVEDDVYYNTDWETDEEAIPVGITSLDQGTDELLKITNKDFQNSVGRKTQTVFANALTSLRGTYMKMKVDGEKPTVITTPSISISFEKNQAEKLVKNPIQLGDVGKVELPDWCAMQSGSCNPNASVMIQASYTIFHPNAYTKNAAELSKYSGALNIDLFGDNGANIPITRTSEPIQLNIPLDRNMPKPNEEFIVPFIPDRDSEHFFYQTTKLTTSRGSIQQVFRNVTRGNQLLVLIKLGDIKNIVEDFDYVCMIPHLMQYDGLFGGTDTLPDPYTCFVDSDSVNGYTGDVSFAIRQMQQAEFDRYITKSHVPKQFPKYSGAFTTNYTSQFVSACCKYFDESLQDWSTAGCKVGAMTNEKALHCECTHLTTFAGGWVVVPNTIDWNFVFSNMDFYKNPTLYVTQIVIIVIYLLAVVWARRQDKRDVEKLGLTPLADNNKQDHYYYEIVVVTGMRRNAGTDSKVSFILTGDEDETEVRELVDKKRKILRRGSVDGFLMSVPRPLGQLTYLHIWHDNAGKGKFASWYMRSIVVRDVQTDDKYIFIGNRWLAVEEDDGMIDRIIPVAGKEQMTEFSHLFSEKTTKSLSDGHLWFSVVARPPQSRFTRVQRVSCCLCLLYMTMISNAMFYEKGESGDASSTFTFGPFALTPEQIYIGVVCNIIVFPINFLVILIFRRSRPRKKRPSRIQEALNVTTKPATSVTDVNPTLKPNPDTCPTPQILEGNRPETSLSRGQTSLSIADVAHNDKKKKKSRDLPWWFVFIGWTLLWLATLTSAAFVTFYGVQFQDLKCKKWITSMLISFFTSVFITQPVKVFLTAIFFSLVIKNPGGEEDDDVDDEEKPRLAQDEELLHKEEDVFAFTKPKKAPYRPPNPQLLQKAREVRMKEIKMWGIVREIVFYAFFLWILMVISYRNRSYNSYLYKQSLEKVFIVTNDTKHQYTKIKNQNDFWVWAKSGLISGLRAGVWYNNGAPIFMRGYINDKQSRIMGYATMRQLRIKSGTCKIPKDMKSVVNECNDEYSVQEQDEQRYRVGWLAMTGNASLDITREEYTYTSAKTLDGYPYFGTMAVYSGGGYVVKLRGNSTVMLAKMKELQAEGWIDKYTRAIFIEFTVYNPGVNLFGISTLLLEVRPSQGIFPSYRFEPSMLLPYMDSVMLFQIVCQVVYLLFTVFFTVQLFRGLYRQKLDFFKEFWNLVDIGICAMSVTAIVIYFYLLFETNRLTDRFKISHGNEYMKFQYVGYWSEVFSYIIGWLVFFASLKFLKLLRFNKRISLLASTLKSSAKDLMHFSIIFNIIFMAFIQLFYLVYAANITSFKTIVSSCESGIVMMMGKFDIYEMIAVEPIMTQIFIFGYVVTITFITVNMFLSILNETFSSVRSDIAKQCNDYEIIDFMLNRFKMWTGLGVPDASAIKPDVVNGGNKGERDVEEFPDRIDRLLHSISYMYMEKDRLDTLLDMNDEKAQMKRLGLGTTSHPPPARSQKYQDPKDHLPMVHTNY